MACAQLRLACRNGARVGMVRAQAWLAQAWRARRNRAREQAYHALAYPARRHNSRRHGVRAAGTYMVCERRHGARLQA